MIKSMTGYGRNVVDYNKRQITIEVKTVNHRFLDIAFKMPRELFPFENQLKHSVQNDIKRGRVDLYLSIKGEGISEKEIQINWNLLNQYIDKTSEIQANTAIGGSLTIENILQLEDVFYIDEKNDLDDGFISMMIEGLQSALNQVVEMRTNEGEALFKDFSDRLMFLKRLADHVQTFSEEMEKAHFQRLKEKMLVLMDEKGVSEERIIQEAAIQIEKADISEELTRLYSHIEQFTETLEIEDSIGRKLDFISQEMLREVNTMASKSNLSEISKTVVEMKSEIEKIKEQVQNIE